MLVRPHRRLEKFEPTIITTIIIPHDLIACFLVPLISIRFRPRAIFAFLGQPGNETAMHGRAEHLLVFAIRVQGIADGVMLANLESPKGNRLGGFL